MGGPGGVDKALAATQGDAGEAAALQTGGVHQPVGGLAEVAVVGGRPRPAAGPLPRGAVGALQRAGQGAGGLTSAAQPHPRTDDQAQQRRADGGAVQRVPVEGAAHRGGGGQGAGDDRAGADPAGLVGGEAVCSASEETGLITRGMPWTGPWPPAYRAPAP